MWCAGELSRGDRTLSSMGSAAGSAATMAKLCIETHAGRLYET